MKPYYQEGGVTIYHAAAQELLQCLVDVDLVLTDPPYGNEGQQNTEHRYRRGHKNAYLGFEDSQEYVKNVCVPIINELLTKTQRLIMTPGNKSLCHYPAPDSFGAFFQPASVGLQSWGRADAQPIFYYGEFPHDSRMIPGTALSFTVTEAPEKNGHPCPKPIKVWSKLLALGSLPGEFVLDPFMGSGTTLRAAKDLGRKCIGIEIEEEYCEIAAKRLAQEVFEFTF